MNKYFVYIFRRYRLASNAWIVNCFYLVVTFALPVCFSSFLIAHSPESIRQVEWVSFWVDFILSFQPDLVIVPVGYVDPYFVKFYHVMMISIVPLISLVSVLCVLFFGRDYFVDVAREIGSKVRILGMVLFWGFVVCGVIFLPHSYGTGRGDLLYESRDVMLMFGWIPYVLFLFLNSAFFVIFVSLFFSCEVPFFRKNN